VSKEPAKKPARKSRQKKSAALLGLGLDNDDGHKRITSGEKFLIVGGSQQTHEVMTETVVKTFEELKRRAKRLETIDPRELDEIIDKAQPR
jgi:hypothetical protein